MKARFEAKVRPDIGANVHVADVYMHTAWVAGERIDAVLGDGFSDKLRQLPRTPETFPSLFSYDFTY